MLNARRIAVIAGTAVVAGALAPAPGASAAVTCQYDSASGLLNVQAGADGEVVGFQATVTGDIHVRQQGPIVPCTGGQATTTNTDAVLAVDNSDNSSTPAPNDGDTIWAINSPTSFAPGATLEQGNALFSEIEFTIDPNDGRNDRIQIGGTTGVDDWVLGTDSRINWNAGVGDPAPDSEFVLTSQFDNWALDGGEGNDEIRARGGEGTGNDPFNQPGFLEISGASGNDTIEGSDSPDPDRLDGGDDNDDINGFAGDDVLIGDDLSPGDDLLRGGAGAGDMYFHQLAQAGMTVDLAQAGAQNTGSGMDTLSEIEAVQGTVFADTIRGDDGPNLLNGSPGDDTLEGRGGPDTLEGQGGVDTASYAQAPAGVTANLTTGAASGGAGDDTLSEVENLVGSSFADSLTGSVVTNAISALAGDDSLDVRDGAPDTADCGPGTDSFTADPAGTDTLTACENDLTAAPPGSGVGTGPPDTTITKAPKDKTKKKKATFEFSSTSPGSSFNCVLDGRETFKPCTSPITVKVKKGKHTFEVVATDAAGNADPTPARDSWKRKKKKKKR
jgi:Ca2+-binding RTX toxin-like protein